MTLLPETATKSPVSGYNVSSLLPETATKSPVSGYKVSCFGNQCGQAFTVYYLTREVKLRYCQIYIQWPFSSSSSWSFNFQIFWLWWQTKPIRVNPALLSVNITHSIDEFIWRTNRQISTRASEVIWHTCAIQIVIIIIIIILRYWGRGCRIGYCSLLALLEDDWNVHARVWLVAAHVRVVDDVGRVAFNSQWTVGVVVGEVQCFSFLSYLQSYVVATVRPGSDTAM